MTDFLTEQAEQQRWQLLPDVKHVTWFDDLLANEFLSVDEQQHTQLEQLQLLLGYVAVNVPWYRSLFQEHGISPADIKRIEDLHKLPVLERGTLRDHYDQLQALRLPAGQELGSISKTSGSTGQLVMVQLTRQTRQMSAFITCRQARWFRYDPQGVFAAIRPAKDLPRKPDGSLFQKRETCKLDAWPNVGRYFQTGPFIAALGLNGMPWLVKWLSQHQPNYLGTSSGRVEHLAFECGEVTDLASIKGVTAFAQMLTPGMRKHAENVLGAPVNENYGLNEVGIVAIRCPEGGRYHVQREHCLVEIVDDQGKSVAPGVTGHLLVTALTNVAMPLIRYDTGDLAEAVSGPCPCGRTLPAFAGLRGRYSRIAHLPEGTMEHWAAIEHAMDDLPPPIMAILRQYQTRQFKDHSSELRVVATEPLPAEFMDIMHGVWNKVTVSPGMALRIAQVDAIQVGKNEKFERFISALTPSADA